MPNKDFPGRKWSTDEILNFTAVDTDDDGNPDANGVCNPDGSPVGSSARLVDDCEDYTKWSAVGAAITIAASTTHRIGAKSVSFAKDGSAVVAAIQKSWPVAINYGVEEAAREAIQWTLYLPTIVGVVNVFLRLGVDATKYAQVTVPVAGLTGAAWNRISVPFLSDTLWTQTGTGFDTANLKYVAVGIETAVAATAIAGILVDNILSIDYVETSIRVVTAGTGNVNIVGDAVGLAKEAGGHLEETADHAHNIDGNTKLGIQLAAASRSVAPASDSGNFPIAGAVTVTSGTVSAEVTKIGGTAQTGADLTPVFQNMSEGGKPTAAGVYLTAFLDTAVAAAPGTQTVIAADAAKKIVIVEIDYQTDAQNTFILKSNGVQVRGSRYVEARGGGPSLITPQVMPAVNEAVQVTNSAQANWSITITYYKV